MPISFVRFPFWAGLALLFAVLDARAENAARLEVPLYRNTVVRFADVEEARNLITTRDDYITASTPFERQSILKSQNAVSEEEFLDYLSQQVLEWDDWEIERNLEVIGRLAVKLSKWDLRLPDVIYFVRTTGQTIDCFFHVGCRVFYTRLNAIFIPPPESIFGMFFCDPIEEEILVHELFHILTRYNPELRDALYAIAGFHPCPGEIIWPEKLVPRMVVNPDAPRNLHYIDVTYQIQPVQAVPVLYAYKDYAGGVLCEYFQSGFAVIEPEGADFRCKMESGLPVILKAEQLENFYEQIGRNTDYIIQPEELLAVNFQMMVQESPGVVTPWIIEAMARQLTPAGNTSVSGWRLY
ncbi:MAG: hypothetical protein ACE15F_18075 [bacterium]